MFKKITRKVMKEVEETVSSVGICDICGKEFNYEPWFGKEKIASYYHIRTGHYDWAMIVAKVLRVGMLVVTSAYQDLHKIG